MESKIYAFLAIFFFSVFAFGLYDSPLSRISAEEDFDVEAEYLSGVITASGILFGLWAIVLERKPTDKTKKGHYETFIKETFLVSLSFLIVSVIVIALTAVNFYSPSYALFINTLSFCAVALSFTITIYFFKFKET